MKNFLALLFVVIILMPRHAFSDPQGLNSKFIDNDATYANIKKNINKGETENSTETLTKIPSSLRTVLNSEIPDCYDTPLSITDCIPGICYETLSFGKVYRKVKGLTKDGSCEYVERTIEMGGLNCAFSLETIEDTEALFIKFYERFSNPSIFLTPEESLRLSQRISSECQVVQDGKFRTTINMEDPVPYNIDPELVLNDTQGWTAPKPDSQKGETYITNLPDLTSLSQTNKRLNASSVSIMFTKAEIEAINEAVQGNNIPRNRIGGMLNRDGKNIFSLSGLIFYNKNEWTFWLNGTKHSSLNSIPESVIEEVTKNSVRLNLNVKDLDKLAPGWRNKLIEVDENSYASASKNIQVQVFPTSEGFEGVVKIELHPNQKFDLNNMIIIEGRG